MKPFNLAPYPCEKSPTPTQHQSIITVTVTNIRLGAERWQALRHHERASNQAHNVGAVVFLVRRTLQGFKGGTLWHAD